MDPTDTGDTKLFFEVDENYSAPSARETTAQDKGGLKKKEKGEKKKRGGGMPKQPRARAKATYRGGLDRSKPTLIC
jgi:hypothetical protein